MNEFNRFDSHFIAAGFEARTFYLVDPGSFSVPPQYRRALLIEQVDSHVAPIGETVANVAVPGPERGVLRVTSLECDVGVLAEANQLAYVWLAIGAFTVVHGV